MAGFEPSGVICEVMNDDGTMARRPELETFAAEHGIKICHSVEELDAASDVPWAMIFPTDPQQLARHPSQLYQFALEGVALFLVLWLYSRKPRPTMAVSGMFALFYGIFRFIVEFVRVPDAQLGYLAFGWVTMGQILCLPMIAGGLFLIWLAYNRDPAAQKAAH